MSASSPCTQRVTVALTAARLAIVVPQAPAPTTQTRVMRRPPRERRDTLASTPPRLHRLPPGGKTYRLRLPRHPRSPALVWATRQRPVQDTSSDMHGQLLPPVVWYWHWNYLPGSA